MADSAGAKRDLCTSRHILSRALYHRGPSTSERAQRPSGASSVSSISTRDTLPPPTSNLFLLSNCRIVALTLNPEPDCLAEIFVEGPDVSLFKRYLIAARAANCWLDEHDDEVLPLLVGARQADGGLSGLHVYISRGEEDEALTEPQRRIWRERLLETMGPGVGEQKELLQFLLESADYMEIASQSETNGYRWFIIDNLGVGTVLDLFVQIAPGTRDLEAHSVCLRPGPDNQQWDWNYPPAFPRYRRPTPTPFARGGHQINFSVAAALNYQTEVLCCFWDLEATGLCVREAEIIQIGATCRMFRKTCVAPHGEFTLIPGLSEQTHDFSVYVKSDQPVPRNIMAMTKITSSLLETQGLELHEALAQWDCWFSDLRSRLCVGLKPPPPVWLIAHNGNQFDLPLLLHQEVTKLGQAPGCFFTDLGVVAVVDSVVLSRHLYCADAKVTNAVSRSHRLSDLYRDSFNVDMPNQHNALYDAKAVASVMASEPYLSAWRYVAVGWFLIEYLRAFDACNGCLHHITRHLSSLAADPYFVDDSAILPPPPSLQLPAIEEPSLMNNEDGRKIVREKLDQASSYEDSAVLVEPPPPPSEPEPPAKSFWRSFRA